jgi:hypothetical protein
VIPQAFVTYDLGYEEFSTWNEMREIIREAHQEAPKPLVAVYITSFQLKMLRFEAFEKRKLTQEQARRLHFKTCLGTRIIVWDGDGIPPCPSCGDWH